MGLRKFVRKLHLWLGLLSGLVVFIVAITGCMYAFQEEIQDAGQSYRFISETGEKQLSPSELRLIADKALPGKHIHAVMYTGEGRAAKAIYFSAVDNYYYFVYINPYSGKVLKVSDEYAGFFRFVLDGHYYLWLPPEIGQPVVATATLVFVVMLITGIVLWWPRNKNNKRQKFKIKWSARWRRKNYDLHSVIGFYISWVAIIFALTGLIWGFVWFRDAVYFATSGGESFTEYYTPPSKEAAHGSPAVDRVWEVMKQRFPNAEWIEIHFPEDSVSAIAANANPDRTTYYKTDYLYFDQNTLEEYNVDHIWGRNSNLSTANKLMRMNYDIHVGSILGLPGKILAFLISLLVASLPVTGVLIWVGRKKKAHKKAQEDQRLLSGQTITS